jgi:hypothetical protein
MWEHVIEGLVQAAQSAAAIPFDEAFLDSLENKGLRRR